MLIDLVHDLQRRVGELTADITERKRAEQEVKRSRALLAGEVEALTDGLVIFDREERLVLCNSRYRQIYRDIAEILEPGTEFEKVARAAA